MDDARRRRTDREDDRQGFEKKSDSFFGLDADLGGLLDRMVFGQGTSDPQTPRFDLDLCGRKAFPLSAGVLQDALGLGGVGGQKKGGPELRDDLFEPCFGAWSLTALAVEFQREAVKIAGFKDIREKMVRAADEGRKFGADLVLTGILGGDQAVGREEFCKGFAVLFLASEVHSFAEKARRLFQKSP